MWLAVSAVVVAATAWRLGRMELRGDSTRALFGGLGARLRRRHVQRVTARTLPQFCEDVARSLRAGLSLRSALIEAAESDMGEDLRRDVVAMVHRCNGGASTVDALDAWRRERSDVPGVALTVAALTLAVEAGGRVARAVDGVADTLRSDAALADEIRSLSSQAEASAVLVAVLPLVFGLVAGATDPQTLEFLVSSQVGRVCLVTGVALDVGAFVWMRRIVRSVA
jgi:tight adherence protein B